MARKRDEEATRARVLEQIEAAVAERLEAARAERRAGERIARLIVDGRRHGIDLSAMVRLVQRLDPRTGKPEQVSRQAVDQMLRRYEQGHPAARNVRGHDRSGATAPGHVNMDALR